jgi:hypothetical protein
LPSSTKTKDYINVKEYQKKWKFKIGCTVYANTNENIQIIDQIKLSQSAIKSINDRHNDIVLS